MLGGKIRFVAAAGHRMRHHPSLFGACRSDVKSGQATYFDNIARLGTVTDNSLQQKLLGFAENQSDVDIIAKKRCEIGGVNLFTGTLASFAAETGVSLEALDVPGIDVGAHTKLARQASLHLKINQVCPASIARGGGPPVTAQHCYCRAHAACAQYAVTSQRTHFIPLEWCLYICLFVRACMYAVFKVVAIALHQL
jgi:hypothetical protein